MMKEILVVTGSARPNSVNQFMVNEVVVKLGNEQNINVKVADLAQLGLPYLNSPTQPSEKSHVISDEKVKQWSQMVKSSDGVVFVAPEYNHSMSGIQKNAVDWLYQEWRDKPTAFVGYGAHSAKYVYETFKIVASVVKMNLMDNMAGIKLGEVVGYDGAIIDRRQLDSKLNVVLDELILSLK